MKYTGEEKTGGWIYRRVVLNFRVDVRSARLGKKKVWVNQTFWVSFYNPIVGMDKKPGQVYNRVCDSLG